MDLENAHNRARFMIRDWDGKFPALFNAVLTDAGIGVVLTEVRTLRMNSVMQRWVQACRRNCLTHPDREPDTPAARVRTVL
jgi:hypothetical protein